MSSVGELLPLIREVELSVAVLYKDMSEISKWDAEVTAFFKHLSKEEYDHAEMVDKMIESSELGFEIFSVNKEELEVILLNIKAMRTQIFTPPMSQSDAIKLVAEFEDSAAEKVYRRLPSNIPGMPKGIIQGMEIACEGHARRTRALALLLS